MGSMSLTNLTNRRITLGILTTVSIDDIPKSSSPKDYDENELWCFTLKYDEEDVPVIILNAQNAPCIDAVELYEPGKRTIRAAVLSADGKDCPFSNLFEETRDKKFRAKKFYIFTVLDLRGYSRSNGDEVKYSKKALLVKGHMMDKGFKKQLSKVLEKKGTLEGSLWEVSRSSNSQPSPASCGDTWMFSEMADISGYKPEDISLLTEDEVMSLFVHDPEELKKLASEWDTRESGEVAEPKY